MTRIFLWAVLALGATIIGSYGIIASQQPHVWPLDWFDFVFSGRMANVGLNPFTLPAGDFVKQWGDLPQDLVAPNLNAPPALPLFQFAALFDARVGLWVMRALNFAAMLGVVALSLRRKVSLAVVVLSAIQAGTISVLYEGQIYGLLGLALALALIAHQRGQRRIAGAILGFFCAVKPNLLLVPLGLFLAGETLSAVWALGVFAIGAGYSIVFYGPRIWNDWLFASAGHAALPAVLQYNASLRGLLWPFESQVAYPVAALAVVTITAVSLVVAKPSFSRTTAACFWAALLISPINWTACSAAGLSLIFADSASAVPLVLLFPWLGATFALSVMATTVISSAAFLGFWGLSLRKLRGQCTESSEAICVRREPARVLDNVREAGS